MAADEWLDHVPIPKDQLHLIPAELGANAAALAYAETLRNVPEFDLVLLGLGDDGQRLACSPIMTGALHPTRRRCSRYSTHRSRRPSGCR